MKLESKLQAHAPPWKQKLNVTSHDACRHTTAYMYSTDDPFWQRIDKIGLRIELSRRSLLGSFGSTSESRRYWVPRILGSSPKRVAATSTTVVCRMSEEHGKATPAEPFLRIHEVRARNLAGPVESSTALCEKTASCRHSIIAGRTHPPLQLLRRCPCGV
jgi:hypothetical protein